MTGQPHPGAGRDIATLEWWFLAHPRRMPPVLQTVVQGEGTVPLADLVRAVAVASAANPDARLRRVGRRWVDSGVAPRVRVVAAAPAEATVAALPELHDALPDSDGALCEVLWSPAGPSGTSSVVFRVSHAVMDGTGKSMWMTDVFRVLRGLDPLGSTSSLTERDLFEHVDATGRATIDTTRKPDVWCPSPLGPAGRGGHRTGWVRRVVDGYHPGVAARIAVALRAVYDRDPVRFSVAFDLRRLHPEVRATGNLVQVETFDVGADLSWEALHEQLLSAMAPDRYTRWDLGTSLQRVPVRALRPAISALERLKGDSYASATLISHLGRLDLDDLSTATFVASSAYVIPLLAALSPPEVNVVECGGRTELTMTFRDGPGTARRAQQVLDATAEALSPARHRVWAGNDTVRPASGRTVVDLFRARVAEDPAAVALRWPGGELTFGELDHRSEVVAARLVGLGVGPGSVVGLVAARSAMSVTGLWGVLKTGAAYLPMEPKHPDHRWADLLGDAGASVCVVPRAHADRTLPPGCTSVVVDDLPLDAPQARLDRDPGVEDLAYVIYTSGSTGTPKGVEIEHRALANYVDWAADRFATDAATTFAVFTSLAFDLPNTALYLSTLAGAPLVLVPDEPNHLSLKWLLEDSGATALKLTPSHLDLIGGLGLRPDGVRLLVVGGEALRPELAARAQALFGPDCRIFNHYGPTEATVGCIVNPYRAEHSAHPVVPIGRPGGNCRAHVLDANRRFVEPGEIGELYLGGGQLARGYRGRPDLTAQRFVRLADGSRVYRSGDLARVLPSGELEFLGRADDQVKILGHRVEPAEAARALERHPAVDRAVVLARENRHGSTVLCAYAVTDGAVTAAELTGFAGEVLPRYLVPSTVQFVAAFEQTANGKIDTSVLPDPFADTDTEADDTAGGPTAGDRTEDDDVRDTVAVIWSRTLGVDRRRIDAGSDFHQLGGNSLLLLQMLAAVCAEIVGPDGEAGFMAQLGQIIRRPSVDTVSELARAARGDRVGVGVP